MTSRSASRSSSISVTCGFANARSRPSLTLRWYFSRLAGLSASPIRPLTPQPRLLAIEGTTPSHRAQEGPGSRLVRARRAVGEARSDLAPFAPASGCRRRAGRPACRRSATSCQRIPSQRRTVPSSPPLARQLAVRAERDAEHRAPVAAQRRAERLVTAARPRAAPSRRRLPTRGSSRRGSRRRSRPCRRDRRRGSPMGLRAPTAQSRTEPSTCPEARVRPSGLKATLSAAGSTKRESAPPACDSARPTAARCRRSRRRRACARRG